MRNRTILAQLALCLAAMAALLVIVEGWKAPFTYRLGDQPVHGIQAAVGFKRINRFETDRAKAQVDSEVPFVFTNNVTTIKNLPADFRTDLEALVATPSLRELPPALRVSFGINPPKVEGAAADDELPTKNFEALKAILTAPATGDKSRLDQIVAEFTQFIQPLEVIGIADPNDLAANSIRADNQLAIVSPLDSSQRIVVSPAEVQLGELLKEGGKLGRTWPNFPVLSTLRKPVEQWMAANTPISLRYDKQTTQEHRRIARANVEPVADTYNPNDVLVTPGRQIEEPDLVLLHAEYDRVEELVPFPQRVARSVTVLLLIAVLVVLNGYYLVRNEPQLVRSPGRLAIYLLLMILAIGLGRVLSYDPWRAGVLPLVTTVMIVAIAYNQVLATLTAFTLTLILTLSTVVDLGQFVVLMSASATGVIALAHVPTRSTLIKVGFWAGAAYFVVSWGTGIIASQTFSAVWLDRSLLTSSLYGWGWCLAAGYLVAGSLPFIEKAFGVVTDISLLEMSDISHPLLQELVRRAPGTYNHSIAMATIGETAADHIGANGLLVRVGAYFHDIGKMLKPQYFIENMSGDAESRHDHLAPAMSTLIIIGHVKDGADLARQHNLPRPILDFIEQHHGTTLVQYFYAEAAKQVDMQPDHRTDAEESSFRYPGPKPQSREAGVMMLADAVESASRTLSEPTPKRIESLVHKLTMDRLLDGQFNDSSLTLSEIHAIEESLTKSLIGIYHGRIKYPEQRTA